MEDEMSTTIDRDSLAIPPASKQTQSAGSASGAAESPTTRSWLDFYAAGQHPRLHKA